MKFSATLVTACAGLLASCSVVSAADTLKEAFTEGTLRGELRTFYFSRDFDGDTLDKEDLSFGTLLYYKSAPLKGLSVGLATATSSDIGSDEDKAVYGLLGRNDDGSHKDYARLQEYYLQGDWFDTKIKFGAQEANLPLLITQDVRMSPRTYRGLTVKNTSIDNLTIQGAYITDYMIWFDDEFRNMGDVAKGDVEEDEPLVFGGLKYEMSGESQEGSAEVWYYHMTDYFTSTLLNGYYQKRFENSRIHLFPSFLKQDSTGDNLAGEFDTYLFGFKARYTWKGFQLQGYFSQTGDNEVFDPWSGARILVQQVHSGYRAEETGYGARLAYDFGQIGIKGLSAYIFQGFYDTPDSGENASSDLSETDFSIQYKFSGTLEGLSLRGRYAMVDYDDDTVDDIDDLRLYLKYTFNLNGK
jgi:hypothetical protein